MTATCTGMDLMNEPLRTQKRALNRLDIERWLCRAIGFVPVKTAVGETSASKATVVRWRSGEVPKAWVDLVTLAKRDKTMKRALLELIDADLEDIRAALGPLSDADLTQEEIVTLKRLAATAEQLETR